jgi:hypothetical protein
MAVSLLARTMSMFDNMVVKNGQSLYMAWSGAMPSRRQSTRYCQEHLNRKFEQRSIKRDVMQS